MREAEDDVGEDGPEFGEGAGGKEVDDGLFEVVEDDAAVEDGGDNAAEGVEENHVLNGISLFSMQRDLTTYRSFNSNVRTSSQRNTNICGLEGRS